MIAMTSICVTCGSTNPHQALFCSACGEAIDRVCPRCGAANDPPAKFCNRCGSALEQRTENYRRQPLRVPAPTNASWFDGERKVVTALFADITDSTELLEKRDPEEAQSVVDPAIGIMIDAVHHYGGYVAQSTGDGVFALFGAPIAYEDHPQRALFAALRMQNGIKDFSQGLTARGEHSIAIRIGVNWGEVVLRNIKTGEDSAEYTPIGHVINLASRLQTIASPGSIVIGSDVQKLIDGFFATKPLGRVPIRGMSDLVETFEVTGLGPIRTRLQKGVGQGLSKFVGRQSEMSSIRQAAALARSGHGQILALLGEPGVGKSRILLEFKTASKSEWVILEAFSFSYGKNAPFQPIIDLLSQYFGITPDLDVARRRERVSDRIHLVDPLLKDSLPYLYDLLGLAIKQDGIGDIEAETRRRRSLDAAKNILLLESIHHPLVLIFEDLHWVDGESQRFLNLLAESVATACILMLVSYRPEYSHDWGKKTYYSQIRLDPLRKQGAEEMLSALLGDDPQLAELRQRIIDRTEGNPFFMEESVQSLVDGGSLQRVGFNFRPFKPLRDFRIPPTVQDILAARIDRLPPELKNLLQILAVIGMEFKQAVVSRTEVGANISLERMLAQLQASEFIYERPSIGDTEYVFKHALTHDVAYGSLLNDRRRMLHEQVGDALEATYPQDIQRHLPELVHHYSRSNNSPKALLYCQQVIAQCIERGSNAEAVAYFESGLDLLRHLPDDNLRTNIELDLRNQTFSALMTIHGWASREVDESNERARELCERLGFDSDKAWNALVGIFFVHATRPDVPKACNTASELLTLALKRGRIEYIAAATTWLSAAQMLAGNFAAAAEGFDRVWVPPEVIPNYKANLTRERAHLMASNRAISGLNLWFLGYPDRALERVQLATDIAQESGFKYVMEVIHGWAAQVHDLRREVALMKERAEATLLLATHAGTVSRRQEYEIYRAWAECLLGDPENGIAHMRLHLAKFTETGAGAFVDYFRGMIATACGWIGQIDDGLRTIDEAFPIIEKTGQHLFEAEIYRMKGVLMLQRLPSDPTSAAGCFETAIDISRKQGAKSWELRATTCLARLLGRQGRGAKGQAMLAAIYDSFSEGFETPDLIEAKSLLNELG